MLIDWEQIELDKMCKARELRPLAAPGCLATGLLFAVDVVVLFDCTDDVLFHGVGRWFIYSISHAWRHSARAAT